MKAVLRYLPSGSFYWAFVHVLYMCMYVWWEKQRVFLPSVFLKGSSNSFCSISSKNDVKWNQTFRLYEAALVYQSWKFTLYAECFLIIWWVSWHQHSLITLCMEVEAFTKLHYNVPSCPSTLATFPPCFPIVQVLCSSYDSSFSSCCKWFYLYYNCIVS